MRVAKQHMTSRLLICDLRLLLASCATKMPMDPPLAVEYLPDRVCERQAHLERKSR